MKKRVLSMFMALALCLTLLPTAALADELGPVDGTSTVETAGADAEAGAKAKAGAEAVAAVQAMISELPSLGELKGMDSDTLNEAYMAVQSAYDAYEALTAEQQAQVSVEKLTALLGWFSSQVAPLADEVTGNWLDEVDLETGEITQGKQNWTATPLGNSDGNLTLTGGNMYVVGENQEVTIDGDLTMAGNSQNYLILFNGAKLIINGALILERNGLNIYSHTESQKLDTIGQITVNNSKEPSGAAIRSSTVDARTLNLYGGKLTAKGGEYGAVSNVYLNRNNRPLKATLGGELLSPADWAFTAVNSPANKDLVIEWCTHPDEYDSYVNNGDGLTHHLKCDLCGFEWTKGEYSQLNHEYDKYEKIDETYHKATCVCGYEASAQEHKFETGPDNKPVWTSDGKGHVSGVCACGYSSGTVKAHDYNESGTCKDCGFKPAFEDSKGNLYEYNGSDSIDALNEAIKKGETSFKLVNFAQGEGADAATVEAAFALETDASVTLNMNGYTLENGGAPVITVEAGTLNITGAAVISQAAKSKELVAPAIKVTGGALTFDNVVTATGSAADSSAAPAILIGGGTVAFEQDVTATAVENAGLYTAIAPAIKVTGGKAVFNGKLTATGGLGGVPKNTRPCEPAIYANGGELDFNGDLDLNGGLTITGDAKLTKGLTRGTFKVDYTGERVNGNRVSVVGSANYKNLNSLLAADRAFVSEDETRKYPCVGDNNRSWGGDVTIQEHTHVYNPAENYTCECGVTCDHSAGYENGRCKTCKMPCPHRRLGIGDRDCLDCGQRMYVVRQTKNSSGDTLWFYYTDLPTALAAAEDGDTVKLVDDIDQSNKSNNDKTACLTGDGKTVTLNLNGKNITGGWIYVGIDQDGKAINSSRLNITGSGSFDGMIGISAKGTLDLSGWDGGTIKTVSSSQNGSEESKLISGENKGTITSLQFYSWPSNSIKNNKLTGGTYGSIPITMNSDGYILFSDLLAPGYAFQYTDSGAFVDYAAKAEYGGGSLSNVKVVRCTSHEDADSDSHCDYCNTDLSVDMVATLTVGGKTYYYTDLSEAIEEANKTSGKIAITLLKNVSDFAKALVLGGASNWKDNDITLDLNGKTLSGTGGESSTFLTVDTYGTVTIRDSGTTGLIKNTKPGGNYAVYVSTGKLIIEAGTFAGTDNTEYNMKGYALGVCAATLNIASGTFNSPVTVQHGNVKISGGTFASLLTFDNTAISTLLADGYTLKYNDGSWLNDVELAAQTATNVTAVQAPIHSVTLLANDTPLTRNEDGWYTLSVEYGQPVILNVSAQGPVATKSLTWCPVKLTADGKPEMTDQPLSGQNDKTTLDLSTLTIGKHAYAISVSDSQSKYQVTSHIIITVTPRDLKNATVKYYTTDNPTVVTYNPLNNHICGLPIYEVTLDGVELKEGTDYIISGNTAAEVGKYTAILTAKPGSTKCKGTLKIEWEAVPYALLAPVFLGSQTYTKTYDGTTTLPEEYTFLALFPDKGAGHPEVDWREDEYKENYEVTSAEFVSPDAGENKPINQTITLKNGNFVFEPTEIINVKGITTADRTITYTNFTPKEAYPSLGTTFNIKKATVPNFDKAVTLEVINDLENTYTIDLPALPALESPKTYGNITYTVASQSLEHGYATLGQPTVKQVDGKYQLCLTVPAVKYDQETSIGTILVKVTTTNYNDVVLTVNLQSVNKRTLGMFVSVATDPVVYGMTLGDIKLSAEATDGVQVIPGTIAWEAPLTTIPAAGQATYRWTFTPDDTMHYLTASNTIHFSVDKATPTGAPTYTAITAGGKTLADAALTANASWPSGTVQWVDKDGKPLPASTQVQANTEYTWSFTPADADNYNGATGSVTLYAVTSGGGSSSGGGGSSSAGKTTTTNADGSVTKTEIKADGTVIATTTAKDGSVTRIETKPDGSSVTQRTLADGSTGTVKTDKNGQTTAETTLSSKAIEDAKKSGEPVKAPVEVKASRDSSTAPTVKVELPRNSGETKVEIPVTNVKPGTVAVLVHPDGTEEILKASVPTENGIRLTVDGNATVKIVDNSKDFVDTRNHWAREEIDFVSARELVNGISATRYAPDATATRAQLWTILARQNDTDLSGGANWYEKAQLWSKDKGISDGTNPNGTINRAQMVTMLWRTMGQPAAGGSASFADVPADSYYAQAVAWAIENGITAGVGGGRFDPNSTCTRAQIATFLARSMK